MKDKYYEEYRKLGLSLSFLRKDKAMTQQELADTIDVNYETISRIENANTGISLDMMFAISKALDVPLSEIFRHAGI